MPAVTVEDILVLPRVQEPDPAVAADLNPEFTGCFSLRHPIRLRNRQVENRLLEAEKCSALADLRDADTAAALEQAWWELAFVHFHDVFYPFEYPEEWLLAGQFHIYTILAVSDPSFIPAQLPGIPPGFTVHDGVF